jgi:hypothetical protein
MGVGLRMDTNQAWHTKSNSLLAMSIEFPVEMAIFYDYMAKEGVKLVQDELMARVYNTPLPVGSSWGTEPSPRTGRTLRAVKGSSNAMTSRVFIDRRSFSYFYPWILEFGRKGTAYYGRGFFRAAMRKLELTYFKTARVVLDGLLKRKGLK